VGDEQRQQYRDQNPRQLRLVTGAKTAPPEVMLQRFY
jgi:hypothetical protein